MESEQAGAVRDREEFAVLWSETLSLREEVAAIDRVEAGCVGRYALLVFAPCLLGCLVTGAW